jgi:hypothetical protein
MPRKKAVVPSKVIEKGAPIIIPNKEEMTKEEIKKFKHRETMRRYMARRRGGKALVKEEKHEVRKINTEQMVEMSKDTRNLAIQTLNKKLIELYDNPETLEKTNLATLATVFGILFDKTQLMAGLATENIAIQAKIDVNMKSDDAIKELNKMREQYQDQHK